MTKKKQQLPSFSFPKELIEAARNGTLDESQIMHTSLVNVDVPPGMSMKEAMQFNVDVIQPRMAKLSMAHLRFEMFAKLYGNSNMEYERYYRDLYQDICEHKDTWFNFVFKEDTRETQHCERATGILGTLCTLLRQRGDLKECMEIMPMYTKVLERYQQMSAARPGVEEEQVDCCKALTYKYHLIRINCGIQLRDCKMACKSFRAAVEYELLPGCPFEEYWSMMIPMFGGLEGFRTASDEETWRILLLGSDDTPQNALVQLRKCGACEKEEECLGDYKFCSRCHKRPYCSKECQASDWKVHKLLCGNKNTTNVDADTLRAVATLVTNNFAQTVQVHTGKAVSQHEKDAAMPGLLKLFKKLLNGKFAHFNSHISFPDGGRDVDFQRELSKYFGTQPGYESVAEIFTRPGVQERLKQEASSEILQVDDDIIQDIAGNVVKNLPLFCASKGIPFEQAKQEPLVEDTVQLIKKFMLEHPENNSYQGLYNLKDKEDFQDAIVELIETAL